jgi:hypothetical protein
MPPPRHLQVQRALAARLRHQRQQRQRRVVWLGCRRQAPVVAAQRQRRRRVQHPVQVPWARVAEVHCRLRPARVVPAAAALVLRQPAKER